MMPRTVEQILAHADELAARFENYEPAPADEIDPAVLTALREAAVQRARVEAQVLEAVRQAREAGAPWSLIGNLIGTSGEAVRQRYAGRLHGDGVSRY